mgnify:CR=1 FL=1
MTNYSGGYLRLVFVLLFEEKSFEVCGEQDRKEEVRSGRRNKQEEEKELGDGERKLEGRRGRRRQEENTRERTATSSRSLRVFWQGNRMQASAVSRYAFGMRCPILTRLPPLSGREKETKEQERRKQEAEDIVLTLSLIHI